MLTAIAGSALGGLFRMVPEVLKWLDRKDERKHELNMFDKQLQADAARSQQHIDEIHAQAGAALDSAEMNALIEATHVQGQLTGVKWVDGISALVRPILTFWWAIVLYTAALAAQFIFLTHAGTSYVDAILRLWGDQEKAIAASIISFWFVDRALRKGFAR